MHIRVTHQYGHPSISIYIYVLTHRYGHWSILSTILCDHASMRLHIYMLIRFQVILLYGQLIYIFTHLYGYPSKHSTIHLYVVILRPPIYLVTPLYDQPSTKPPIYMIYMGTHLWGYPYIFSSLLKVTQLYCQPSVMSPNFMVTHLNITHLYGHPSLGHLFIWTI
jgi:hypothetical protein